SNAGWSSAVALFTFAAIGVTIVTLVVLLALRDRASLSRAENALVHVCAIVAAISIPLLATDFRADLGWPPVRLGAIGVLLFCYSMLRDPQENARAMAGWATLSSWLRGHWSPWRWSRSCCRRSAARCSRL